jgi:DNA-binding XRE family transcriptional regulator
MNRQIIVTPAGERLVVLAEADYEALVEAAEDIQDAAAVQRFQDRLALGQEELIPLEMVERMLAGENRIKVWREHRGLTITELASAAGLSQPYLSQIENGARKGRGDKLQAIAKVLGVELEDISP